MIATVLVVVFTHDLAQGVLGGRAAVRLLLRAQGRPVLYVGSTPSAEGRERSTRHRARCSSRPPIASSRLRLQGGHRAVRIDVSRAHFWDITAVTALDKVVLKFRREGTEVEVIGLNEASATLVDRFAVHDKPDAVERLMGH
jgi:SulP family sulfate permease